MPLPLPQLFVQGHNATLHKVNYFENVSAYTRNAATDNYNELLMNLIKETFINCKEDHRSWEHFLY